MASKSLSWHIALEKIVVKVCYFVVMIAPLGRTVERRALVAKRDGLVRKRQEVEQDAGCDEQTSGE